MTAKIEPCPFCGGEATEYHEEPVSCAECNCWGPICSDAVESWNAAAVRLRAAIAREREECAKALDEIAAKKQETVIDLSLQKPRYRERINFLVDEIGAIEEGAAAIRARKDTP